jgi:predicted GNAT family acetyltransferase
MDLQADKLDVIRNAPGNRFETRIEGQLAKLDYLLDGDTLVITHVGVPVRFRGRGVAGRLVQVSLEYARAHALRVIPMCPYAAAYIRRNPQYADLMKPAAAE